MRSMLPTVPETLHCSTLPVLTRSVSQPSAPPSLRNGTGMQPWQVRGGGVQLLLRSKRHAHHSHSTMFRCRLVVALCAGCPWLQTLGGWACVAMPSDSTTLV